MLSNGVADVDLCRELVFFAADIDRRHFRLIYWLLSAANISMLSLASAIYIRSLETHKGPVEHGRRDSLSLRLHILYCFACVLLSAGFVITEAFLLVALQFCDGEPLITLYWSTWTSLQIGSLVAIIGIALAISYTAWERKTPPWGLALGTPILVIAGILHLLLMSVRTQNAAGQNEKGNAAGGSTNDLKRAGDEVSVGRVGPLMEIELLGTTPQGDPLVRLLKPLPLTPRSSVMSYCKGERESV